MSVISNSIFTQTEYSKYVEDTQKADVPLPTIIEINEKLESFKKTQDFVYDEKAINAVLKEKK